MLRFTFALMVVRILTGKALKMLQLQHLIERLPQVKTDRDLLDLVSASLAAIAFSLTHRTTPVTSRLRTLKRASLVINEYKTDLEFAPIPLLDRPEQDPAA